ncbi:MAG: rhodanese-like domain-containing protein [Enterobacteriaceae bacterium]
MQEIMQFVGRHTILSLAWIGLLMAVVYMTFKSLVSKIKEINRAAAIQLMNKEEAVVVDLRTREEFRKGHIINAVNLTPSEIKAGNLGELNKEKSHPLIVACANGTTARQSAEILFKAGFTRVYTLKDGISGWQGENMPLVKGK